MMKFSKLHPLQDWILLLASIHVPMTMYLFTDPAIRTQVRNGPIKFIVVPILLFAVCLLFFLASTRDIMQHKANVLTFFLVSVLSWNLWHFGKQNIGVYAYYRLSQSTGGMLPIERRLLYIGAFLGAISVSYLGLKGYQPQYSTDTFGYWNNMADYVSVSGKYLQYIVSMFSAVYIIYNRERFGWKTALIFFLCVNYFLPSYLSLDVARWGDFYAASGFSHGVQYIVFLLFHSFNTKPALPVSKKPNAIRIMATHIYVLIFVCCFLVIGDFYYWHKVFPVVHFANETSEAYWSSLFSAIAAGILVNHFWFDSFFWKFKNKEARDWMLERYSFLFKPASIGPTK